MKGEQLISLDQALAAYPRALRPLAVERVSLDAALNRVLAEDVTSPLDLPRHDQSALDGYALRAEDAATATAEQPVQLTVRGEVAAGIFSEAVEVLPGTAVRISTGAWLPKGGDCMVAQERVARESDHILLKQPPRLWQNIRRTGEEVRTGECLAAGGERLTPGLIASLAAAGIVTVPCYRAPSVAVLVTGNEVVPAGRNLQPGQAYEVNGHTLHALLQAYGLAAPSVSHVTDDPAATEAALRQALSHADIVITTGGASVGEHDLVRAAARRIGFKEIFWGVAQKPGKPMFFATLGAKTLLGLPGNPAAVMICAALHLRRILDCLQGLKEPSPYLLRGRLQADVEPDRSRLSILRVNWRTEKNGEVLLEPLGFQASHMLKNLRAANGLALIQAGHETLPAGHVVQWCTLG